MPETHVWFILVIQRNCKMVYPSEKKALEALVLVL